MPQSARLFTWLAATFLSAVAGVAAAQGPPPNYGYEWATIGGPGNVAFQGGQNGQLAGRGAVGYEYRIARTEVTNADWVEFCRAFAPHYQGDPLLAPFTGGGVYGDLGPNGWEFGVFAGFERLPRAITPRLAMRYCNWLTNGKASEAWAFESGAYDTSTFTQNPDGTYNDQKRRTPGALFWIPSLDEWMKAGYFDPNNGGPNVGCWWDFPYGSSVPPVPGPPGEGQTNASYIAPGPGPGPYAVGSYPGQAAPWGLLDVSGGMAEITEDRFLLGSQIGSFPFLQPLEDRLGAHSMITDPNLFTYNGLRLASVVPGPASACVVLFGVAMLRARRQRRHGGN